MVDIKQNQSPYGLLYFINYKFLKWTKTWFFLSCRFLKQYLTVGIMKEA